MYNLRCETLKMQNIKWSRICQYTYIVNISDSFSTSIFNV